MITTRSAIEAFWKNDFLPLEAAGKKILTELREDEASGDLHRRILSPGSHLYFQSRSTFQHERSVPLPPHLQSQIKTVKMSLLMGLLPQVNLAWMSIDHRLYLWSFEDTDADEQHFMDLTVSSGQCIVSVGLAPPKKGVFKTMVEWCLVISTPDEVMVCALARKEGKLKLVPTRYTLPTDSIPIVSFCGLPDGRIFMGGYDGSLYEFAYEFVVGSGVSQTQKTAEQRLKDYYDGTATSVTIKDSGTNVASQVLKGGKRAIASIWNADRPHKCRKINHSSSAFSAVATAVLPDWLVKTPAAIFSLTSMGPLEKIVHDPERRCLYSLTGRGVIGVYDLRPKELVLKATIDCDQVARQYLSAVAKGHMYATSSAIEFAGGGSSAQAGVGGMDGARSILKLADSDAKAKLLTPISLHVLPRSDSSHLTLLAITAGGLRYYMTSLSSSMDKSNLAPSSRIVMCHIRSPPPVDSCTGSIKESFEEGDVPGGMRPSLLPQTSVDSACYSDGHLCLALQKPLQQSNGNVSKEVGNVIVGTNADFISRKIIKKDHLTLREPPGGVTETVSLPTDILPGGRIIDSCALGFCRKSPLIKLLLNSQTPSDSELSVGFVPPFYPKISNKKKEKQEEKKTSTSPADVARSTALVTMPVSRLTGGSVALQVLSNFLLSRPLGQGISFHSSLPRSDDVARGPRYRVSNRYGSAGFSPTAGGKVVSSKYTHMSARLSPWLLRPAMVSLNEMAMNHVLQSTKTIAVSVGGLHYFKCSTILTALAESLMSAGPNVAQDVGVTGFFNNYGPKQFCTFCLMLAIGCGPAKGSGNVSGELKSRAYKAAFGRGSVPRLDKKQTVENGHASFVVHDTSLDPLIPTGYEFTPSFLGEGVICLAARLLRPIWYKPSVVVTEGQTLKATVGAQVKYLPAKVELLLDENTLEEVRTPLFSLKQLMEQLFRRAVEKIPGARKNDSNQMEIDETSVLTGSMLFQGSMRNQGASSDTLSREEAVSTARLIEERNLHSLYRLISRSVQLLDLLSLLRRAQSMGDLPEVEWGLLHGLTTSQLVQSQDGQERIENLLNSLVSKTKAIDGVTVAPTADADLLAKQLASQCYLFFSPGSRYSYLGFRSANEALAANSSQRSTLARRAAEHFKVAASFWTSAQLVTGRLMHSGEAETYEDKVKIALQYDSPLARAAAALFDIGEFVAIVDICSITASNFRGRVNLSATVTFDNVGFDWEKTLYHKRQPSDASSQSTSVRSPNSTSNVIVVGSVTDQDVVSTCHAVVLHHLLAVLTSTSTDSAKRSMVSACSASSDKDFLRAFFGHLLKTKNESTLFKIESADLEKWLGEMNNPQLMWQYYAVQQKHSKAGELMWNQATEPSPVVALDDRIIFLERSQSSYNSAITALTNHGGNNVEAAELGRKRTLAGEHLDIALLQRETLKAVSSLGLETELGFEKLENLKMKLVEVNDLYNEYAAPLNLHDVCLRILHSCRHEETVYIEQLWKSIICQEILPCCTKTKATYNFLTALMQGSLIVDNLILISDDTDGEDLSLFESAEWLDRLKGNVSSLGSTLYGKGADYVFPVELLVTTMEGLRHALQLSPSTPWPLQVLLQVGVSFPNLMDAYAGIVDREERELMGRADPLRRYLSVKSVVEVLDEWVTVAFQGSNFNRAYRELAFAVESNRLLSQIDAFKAMLSELGGDEVQSVIGRLERVEQCIRRL